MKFGDWELNAVLAGAFRLDGGAMFGVVPKSLWSRVAPADEQNRIDMAMRLLLMRGRGRTVLVDAGAGLGYEEKLEKIYAFEANITAEEQLAPFGIVPGDVTDVIVTHLHFDHGGGLVRPDGSSWRLTYPSAVHHIQRRQWRHALSPNARDRASYFRHRIELIEGSGQLELHDGAWSFDDGVDLLVFDGHTPGQQLPKLTGDGRRLFYCGDLIPMAAHIPIPYVMSYDLQPLVTMEEKARILDQAAREGWILFFEHDPRQTACGVTGENGRYASGSFFEI